MLKTNIVIILSLDIEEIYNKAIQVSRCFLIIFKNALSGSGVFPASRDGDLITYGRMIRWENNSDMCRRETDR